MGVGVGYEGMGVGGCVDEVEAGPKNVMQSAAKHLYLNTNSSD